MKSASSLYFQIKSEREPEEVNLGGGCLYKLETLVHEVQKPDYLGGSLVSYLFGKQRE